MTNVQRIQLGPDTTPIQQGRSAHGRWRMAYHRAGAVPEDQQPVPAAFYAVQDADRLAFALAEGPAAAYLGERLTDDLWTRATADDDWPQNLRDWLADTPRWSEAPAGRTGFICGRLEHNIAGGRIYLAWLGMNGVRLVDRLHMAITLDTTLSEDEAWTPKRGPEPVGMALHAYRGALSGLARLLVFTASAGALGEELADLSSPDLGQGLEDWSAEAERDLAVFDLRLNPVTTLPSTVILTYQWSAPDLCVLAWQPAAGATSYCIEQATTPAFDEPGLLAELTDARQMQYSLSPPASGTHYYRVVPYNQGTPGAPSEPVSLTPMLITPPVLESIQWADDGGYHITWTSIAQATGYELQVSNAPNFEPEDSQTIYRGELAEAYLPPDTLPSRYYRARAINALYAPHTPSPWSRPRRAPARLDTPVFTRVTQERVEWNAVSGARQYAVHVTPKGQDEGQGEDFFTTEAMCGVADQPATYRVRAFRSPQDLRTASEWSEPVTLFPGETVPHSRAIMPLALPVLAGAALLALIVGIGLGIVGLDAYRAANATATRTPLPRPLIQGLATAAQVNVENATAVVVLGTQSDSLAETITAQAAFNQAQTATAAGWTDTPVPSHTPNLTTTVQAALIQAQSATAAAWTETPTATDTLTPSPTLNLTGTVQAALHHALTATAAGWTDTPTPSDTPAATDTLTPSPTPNLTATVQAALWRALTATAAGWTDTPTPSDTPIPTESPVAPDVPATVEAALALALTATETARPSATPTPVPTDTPDLPATVNVEVHAALDATLNALPTPMPPSDWQATVVALLPPGCYVVRLPDAPLPVYRGPSEGYRQALSELVHGFPRVVARWQHGAADGTGITEYWLAIELVREAAQPTGWIRLPDGLSLDDLVDGSDCQPDRDIPLLEQGGDDPLAAALCRVGPGEGEVTSLYAEPGDEDTLPDSLETPLVALMQISLGENGADSWLAVWLEEQEQIGWVRQSDAALSPEGCDLVLSPE